MIEYDVETTGLQWYANDLFLAQAYDPVRYFKEPIAVKHTKGHKNPVIQEMLSHPDGYRAWNTKFDLHFTAAAGYTLPPEKNWHDGMVAAHLIDERRSVALQNRGNALFGSDAAEAQTEKEVKDWLAQETRDRRKVAKEDGSELVRPDYSDVPDEIMYPYAKHDVVLQRNVSEQYMPLINADEKLKELYQLEMGTLAALFHMEQRGVPVDREAAARYEGQVMDSLDTLTDEAQSLAGIATFNPNAPAQVAEALTRRGADLSFAKTNKNGKPSMDEESLKAIDDDLATKILEYRSAYKIFGTYLRPMLHHTEKGGIDRAPYIAGDDHLHPNFRQVGARTGRMSASDPNIQNWHRDNLDLRYLVTAEPGHVLISADLDSIELRIYAAYLGAGRLLEAIKNGDDIHSTTAQLVGLKDRQRIGGVETARSQGKVFNYSMLYGAGVRSIRRYFRVSSEQARAMIDRYKAAYPEVVRLQNNIQYKLMQDGYVTTQWGRQQRVERDARQESYKFTNYIVQGTAADLLKESIVRIHKQGIPMIAVVHDEVLAHVPKEDADEAAHLIREALIDHPRLTQHVPLDAEAQIIEHWSDAKKPGYMPDYERRNT